MDLDQDQLRETSSLDSPLLHEDTPTHLFLYTMLSKASLLVKW